MLQHGLMDSADAWLVGARGDSIASFLFDQGYDVFLTNSRGNKYSREHISLTPDTKEFWDFSFQEMGQFDVPANLNEILRITGKPNLTYIGHSQGTSQMFAALSDTDKASEYIKKRVNKFIGIMPVSYMSNQCSPMLNSIKSSTVLPFILKTLGVKEIFPSACSKNAIQTIATKVLCTTLPSVCDFFLSQVDSRSEDDD
eukprot:TRINITY_DN2842_c0_g1_i1.p1 TRINITY_DN2842_c0_g1~~TRINITY_DN2842_c0_g1_i1.p1  ORF type:complete len:199 (+),score=25.69 TRINITY_DN2842_c0_g1_i1:167-763(+)